MGKKKKLGDGIHGVYGTTSEKIFIDGMPKHVKRTKQKFTRLQLLKKYLVAMDKRVKWGSINDVEIRGYVLDAIKREESKIKIEGSTTREGKHGFAAMH